MLILEHSLELTADIGNLPPIERNSRRLAESCWGEASKLGNVISVKNFNLIMLKKKDALLIFGEDRKARNVYWEGIMLGWR